jgi:acyl-coenzyme A thioesterase PaaI-like protein
VSAGTSGVQKRPEDSGPSLQERYAPDSICFGCGPANVGGLHIRSFAIDAGDPSGDVVADWMPMPGYEAFPGVLNGGIIGALLDCHSNWTAAYHLMGKNGASTPPTTVTADYSIKLLRPTPVGQPVRLRARVVESSDRRAVVEATLESRGEPAATCRGTFVAVREGHPAYNRW